MRGRGRKGSRAFTVADLVVFMAVTAVAGATIVPALTAVRNMADMKSCASHFQRIALGYKIYWVDYSGMMPPNFSGPDNVASRPPYSRWWWASDTDLSKAMRSCPFYADTLVDDAYTFAEMWDCTGWDGVRDGMPRQVEYQMSGFLGQGYRDVPDGVFGADNSPWHPEIDRTDPYPVSWFDVPSKGVLLWETRRSDDDLFTFPSGREARHGEKSNVLFFDGHVESVSQRRIWPCWGRKDPDYLGCWLVKDGCGGCKDSPWWRPSTFAASHSW